MSPLMHKTIFDTRGWNWQQMFLPSTDISHFLKLTEDEKFFGISLIASKLLFPLLILIQERLLQCPIKWPYCLTWTRSLQSARL